MPGAAWRFEAIGVPWSIETARPLAAGDQTRVRRVIDGFDRDWSRFRDDSVVGALADGRGAVPAPVDARAMLTAYAELSEATGGAVNPLVGESLVARGYDAGLSLRDRGARPAPPWQDRLRVRDGTLELTEPAVIDVGALGKGRLVDLVMAALPEGSAEAVVDASGDIAVRGGPHRIGLEHPYDRRRAIGVWTIADAALCASATTRRAWGAGLHHVLDARTGEPVDTIVATWAVAADAMRADGAATALFFEGGPELAARWDAAWVRMLSDGRVEWSPGCGAELFIAR